MAELILAQVGARIGGDNLGSFGARVGRAIGKSIGRKADQALFGQAVRVVGPRMQELHVQGSSEGASIPRVFGRMRVVGEVIWASRFKETQVKRPSSKSSNDRVADRRYSVSIAVGLCEGEIGRIERVWANGRPFDLSRVAWRLHTGALQQHPDPLIEAVEGSENAPAYRGLAYVVFEDLPLDEFGATIPQFAFEVVRAPQEPGSDSLETLGRAVCLIPGSGEFALSTQRVRRVLGPGKEAYENTHARADAANISVALDQLQADLPNCESVLIVTSWFGDDLRCGSCSIRPAVEQSNKATQPVSWSVQGLSRTQAVLVSRIEGAPAYGGTPSDQSIKEAIAALRARGLRVGLYPFVLMDIPPDNTKPDPYGGARQAAYPWRGRITPHPARGQPGAVDKTAAVASQVASFFGTANAAHFSVVAGAVHYTGPAEWSYRRFILHYAALAEAAGGVDLFILGSELQALTTARSSVTSFPAVDALCTLAADVRARLGAQTKLTYAADWTEYHGYRPPESGGDILFHLDSLWAHPAINAVGVDWYPPLSDWRDGPHLDSSLSATGDDLAYLHSRIEGGEVYDWFYASQADRQNQVRSPIADGAFNEPWVFRAKDIRNWWSNSHFHRINGVRAATPTAWTPQSKPIWLIELGCPAIDKGANSPNLFVDPKSAESSLPPFSSGARNDLIQRRTLEAYLTYWAPAAGRNPTSTVYGGPMIDLSCAHLYAYDARPFPQFPGLSDVWGDGANWRCGHWLNGRIGAWPLAVLLKSLLLRAGIAEDRIDVTRARGLVSGFVVDGPAPTAESLEPILAAYGLDLVETEGVVTALPEERPADMVIEPDWLIDVEYTRVSARNAADAVRVRYIDAASDYRFAVTGSRADSAGVAEQLLDAPLALDEAQAEALALRARLALAAARTQMHARLAPPLWVLQPGDRVRIGQSATLWRVETIVEDRAHFVQVPARSSAIVRSAEPSVVTLDAPDPTPAISVFSAPPLPLADTDERPLAAVFASPWRGALTVHAGSERSRVREVGAALAPSVMGVLEWALWPGPIGRWDEGNVVRVRLYGGALESVDRRAVVDGANIFAVRTPDGGLELIQARRCTLIGDDVWELAGLLRGVQGTVCAAPAPVGSEIVRIDAALARLDLPVDARVTPQTIVVPRLGEAPSAPDAAVLVTTPGDLWARPFAPVHVRGQRDAGGDIRISWVRRTRLGGDAWSGMDVPLGEEVEAYRLEILDDGSLKRAYAVDQPTAIYPLSAQLADFGAQPASLSVRVMQLSQRYGYGQVRESILWL